MRIGNAQLVQLPQATVGKVLLNPHFHEQARPHADDPDFTHLRAREPLGGMLVLLVPAQAHHAVRRSRPVQTVRRQPISVPRGESHPHSQTDQRDDQPAPPDPAISPQALSEIVSQITRSHSLDSWDEPPRWPVTAPARPPAFEWNPTTDHASSAKHPAPARQFARAAIQSARRWNVAIGEEFLQRARIDGAVDRGMAD